MHETEAAYELLYEGLAVHEPGAIAVLRAEFHPRMGPPTRDALLCQQTWKPDFDRLEAAGYAVVENLEHGGQFERIGMVPTRQKQETLGLIARALMHLQPSGHVIVSCPNDLGARSYERWFREAFEGVCSESRKRCRVLRIPAAGERNVELLSSWSAALEPRQQEASDLITAPGMFSWEHPDPGSVLLDSLLPVAMEGRGADLGAGYGFLSSGILKRSADVAGIVLVEAEATALDCARLNLAPFGDVAAYCWADVQRWTAAEELDWVVMNPPFHTGSAVATSLGVEFVRKAAQALTKGGMLYMVANAFLPYEKELSVLFSRVESRAEINGYKVIFATK